MGAPDDQLTGQKHENDPAELVIVCSPSLSKMMGALHPAGALYERPVNLERTVKAHGEFVNLLRRRRVQVEDVRDVLGRDVECDVGARVELEKLAAQFLTYEYGGDSGEKSQDGDFYVGETYKRSVLEAMSKDQLVDIIMTIPTVTVKKSLRDTGFAASYRFEPLSNIIFSRDQQVTTTKGIVMARLRSSQRKKEVDVMEYVFKKLGLKVIGRIPEPGYLEGGDFFPSGELSFIGVGARTDMTAVKYMMENDLFGTHTVAVVHDRFESVQERMHLDTVFNILSENCVIMWKGMIGEDSPTRRMVDEYMYCPSAREEGSVYVKVKGDVEFSKYVRSKGYSIIEISENAQLKYGCNILNLGASNIVSIEKETARLIAQAPCFKGKVQYLDFSGVTTMYGGVHCACQVVRRKR